MKLYLLSLFLVVYMTDPCSGACSQPFVDLGDSCYMFSFIADNWYVAREVCHAFLKSRLVIVETSGEQTVITSHLNGDAQFKNRKWWVAAYDSGHEGNWVWEYTGEPLEYSHWAANQNNNESNDCMVMGSDKEHRWSADNCLTKNFFICQKPH